MHVCAAIAAPRLYHDGGVTQFGAELDCPTLRYVLINRTEGQGELGRTHYVEVSDQLFGRYDGIARLEAAEDRCGLVLHLTFDACGLGAVVRIDSPSPMDDASMDWLAALSAALSETACPGGLSTG
jgi:hypothetical protein